MAIDRDPISDARIPRAERRSDIEREATLLIRRVNRRLHTMREQISASTRLGSDGHAPSPEDQAEPSAGPSGAGSAWAASTTAPA
jgi:hypothetical protein